MLLYKINEEGFLQFGEEIFVSDNATIPDGYTDISLPTDLNGNQLPFYKPKLVENKWIEGETAEERADREAQQLLESLKPSPEELADAELEIKLITILSELGVIQ
ncbi:hypothetical protein P9436_21420 [Lysinibacillus capsici]|uniref:hypothetical protein n=1 Tax=Lysinibacillus capsici TaxID=2115968 RepID=UPI002E23544C|nr:hypothetical protein [Lysinibacillus capsici]